MKFNLFSIKAISGDSTIVIDNSSAFRYIEEIPLVVPEINPHMLKNATLIANPNCTTAIAAVVLWPIHVKYGIKKLIMSTYQAASGAGAEGMEELLQETASKLAGKNVSNSVFVHPLPFNLIPHIDKFQENGYTKEEMKVVWETKKIFGLGDDVLISCTAVRIPILRAHSESITIETLKEITPENARELLVNAPGVRLVDDVKSNIYPMPLNATGYYCCFCYYYYYYYYFIYLLLFFFIIFLVIFIKFLLFFFNFVESFDVEVGRIRQSLVFGDRGLDLFVSGDQLLRGAALNAVLIAEKILEL